MQDDTVDATLRSPSLDADATARIPAPVLAPRQPLLEVGGARDGVAAAVRGGRAQPRLGLHAGAGQRLVQQLLQRDTELRPTGLRGPALVLPAAGSGVHPDRRVPALPEPDAAGPLAALADRPLHGPVAVRPDLLPDATARCRHRCRRRQPRPAHQRGPAPHVRPDAGHRARPDERDRHARLVRRGPVVAVGTGHGVDRRS